MFFLNILNPSTGNKKPIITLPKTSLYRNGLHFFISAHYPVFTFDSDLLYIVFGGDPTIYIYNTVPPYSLSSQTPLNLLDYHYFKGSQAPLSRSEMISLYIKTGRILNIKKLNDYFVIAYFPGYDAVDLETSKGNKTPEEAKTFRQRMQRKYRSRITIFDSLGNRLNDIIPSGLEVSSMLMRNGDLWMKEKPDEDIELDYFKLYKVGLKIEKPPQ
ncbi:hypothetical protein DN752_14530 [Echinicola strongylocentroti]|uniref:Uncharacterized protein n=1 Tax=Echinicola strongylocentroti TaxID=1795355 RepID=A0A2Z4IJD7_9BACT|nr:hypothetical protein [Echinicola strongylocentroti]AWW31241.1 hypothetical protein DN752_14530 [Echinicola strongylocentroti]